MVALASHIRGGRNVTVTHGPGGLCVGTRSAGQWRHPWYVELSWMALSGRWVATIKPGFVNGHAPVWRTTVKEEAKDDRDFGINPLTGAKFFSSFVFDQGEAPAEAVRLIDVPLYLSPAISLSWRALGFDGDGAHGVPQFFKDRGAVDSPLLNFDVSGPVDVDALSGYTAPPKGLRLLRACDIWVHQPRPALTSTIEVLPGAVNGLSTFHQTLGEAPPDASDALSIRTGNFDPAPPTFQPLQNDYSEFPWDEKLLATAYLLSPAETAAGAEPDGTWEPHVQHEVFWDLNYEVPVFRQPVEAPGFSLILTLGSAVLAQPIINYVTSEITDGYQRAFNLLQGHSLAGRFWTVTGGGWSVEFPAEPAAPEKLANGGDKRTRLLNAEIAKNARAYSGSLDPAFPYRGLSFDPSLLLNS